MRKVLVLMLAFAVLSCSGDSKHNANKKEAPTKEAKASTVEEKPATPVKINPITADKQMVKISAGSFSPFISSNPDSLVHVDAFYMDVTPVTNAEFLEFLKANPRWTKANILKIYADSTYLHNWVSDFQIPADAAPDAPVTNVSWFAAKAYAESVGKRLPTVAEWEYVAQASKDKPNASDDKEHIKYVLDKYEHQRGKYKLPVKQDAPNYWGVYDMYGVIWEWTQDFNSVMLSDSQGRNAVSAGLYCGGAALNSTNVGDYASFLRYAMRGSLKAKFTVNNVGFRLVKDIN